MVDVRVIRNTIGMVTDILTPFKAIIQFYLDGKIEKALMKKEKFVYEGNLSLSNDLTFHGNLRIGTHIKFVAHNFEPKHYNLHTKDQFGWYIILGWCEEDTLPLFIRYVPGIVNAPVRVDELKNRQGVITYELAHGGKYEILFYGSKVFLFGRRVNSKRPLKYQVHENDLFCCDAIPCDPDLNDAHLKWFATTMWRGTKPYLEIYKNPNPMTKEALLKVLRTTTSNPRTVFVKGVAMVLKCSSQFGLALLRIQETQWSSLMFHRTACFIKGTSLAKFDLRKIFKKGDRIRVIAVSTQHEREFRFAACQVALDLPCNDNEELEPEMNIKQHFY